MPRRLSRHAAGFALTLATAPLVALSVTPQVVNGKTCEVVSWTDADGFARSVALVRADGDTGNAANRGGYIEQYIYQLAGGPVTAQTSNETAIAGMGCAVNHWGDTAGICRRATNASTGFVFQGASHVVWRFRGNLILGAGAASASVTIDYVISEGVNDILWAVSYDCSTVGDQVIAADARGPYFQFDWDGDSQFFEAQISAIRWGDRYRFRTVEYHSWNPAAITWDYTQANIIPYMALEKHADRGDAVAGVVQTQPWIHQDAGGYWWTANWGQTGTGMPENWNCPFQLNAYEQYSGEKMAWGTHYGYVGSSAYPELGYGANRVGYPFQGYSVRILLARHSLGHLDALIGSMEAVQQTVVTASVGSVVTTGPRHAGLAGVAPYQPAGWDHVHGTWVVQAQGNAIDLQITIGSGVLVRPQMIIQGYTAATLPATFTMDGIAMQTGTDYVASLDADGDRVWITFLRDFPAGVHQLGVAAMAGEDPGDPEPEAEPEPEPEPGDPGEGNEAQATSSDNSCGFGFGFGAAAAAALLAACGFRGRESEW